MFNLHNQNCSLRGRVALVKNIAAIGFLSVVVISNPYAQESERIDKLEREMQEIKARLLRLETPPRNQSNAQEPTTSSEGWKSLTNWRMLANGMSTSDVRRILGEPHRIDGGNIAFWVYQNRGQVTFMDEKVYSWKEPR